MTGKDFFSNPLVKKVIEKFKKDGLNLRFSEDDQNWDITYFDSEFAKFSKQTGKTEEFLLDILKNDYDDFLLFVKEQSKDSDEKLYASLFGSDLLLFAILRYDLEKEGAFLSEMRSSYLKDVAAGYINCAAGKGKKQRHWLKPRN